MVLRSAVLLLSACVAVSGVEMCGSSGGTEVCLTLAGELESVVNDCLYTDGFTHDSDGHDIPARASQGATTFATFASTSVNATCEGATLQLSYYGLATLSNTYLPTLSGSTELSIDIDKDGVVWSGVLVKGHIASEGNLTASFEVHQEADSTHTVMHVDIPDIDDDVVELSLPSRVTLDITGLPFFDGSLTEGLGSCPFNPLVGTPPLSVPGVEAELSLEAVSFDPCAFITASTETPVLVIGATLDTEYTLRGVTMPDLSAEVRATLSPEAAEGVHWSGALGATTNILGVSASVAGEFNDEELLSVTVSFDAPYTGFTLTGSVSLAASACQTMSSGSATLSLSGTDLTTEVAITQVACHTTTEDRLWEVTGSVSSALVSGVSVYNVAVQLQSAVDAGVTTWSGTLGGIVAFGSTANTVSATVGVDSASGVTSFVASGSVALGSVTGDVSVSIVDGVASGTGTLAVTTSNAVAPSFTASVVSVLDYNEQNANLPLWDVQGSLASWDVFGVQVTGVQVAFTGVLGAGSSVVWSGSASGSVDIDGTSLGVQTTLADNALTALVGTITVKGDGVTFTGDLEIAPDRSGCTPMDGSGTLTLESGEVFEASMTFDDCATAVGETRFHFEGTHTGDLTLGGLTLSSVSFLLDAQVATAGPPRVLSWDGTLAASANLFGSTSSAQVAFANGGLQSVNVRTAFTTDNQIFSATVDLTYNSGCVASTGVVSDAVLRLQGADDLTFSGTVSYESCSGVMALAGSVGGWNGPAGTGLSGVTITLQSSGGEPSATLASRTWTGTVTATTDAGLDFSLSFDSTTDASSITGTITYEDSHVKASVALSSDCSGSGTLIVRNLDNIPSVEAQASFSRDCNGGVTSAWTLTGTFTGLSIPFNGKVISLPSVAVTLTQDEAGEKHVSLQGDYLSSFYLAIEFEVGGPVDATLRGGVRAGSSASPDAFSSEFSGKSQFPASLGNVGGMLDSMKGLSLQEVTLEVSFSKKTISLSAVGEVFGIDFTILVAAAKTGSWNYGMAFTAENFAGATGLPSPVRTALVQLGPEYVRFSVAKEELTVGDVTLRKGLSLAAELSISGSAIQDVLAVAPSALKNQINGAGSGAALTLVADIVSTTELSVFIQLAGDIPLGKDVSLRTVALAFKISGTGSPEMGFVVDIDFTLGNGGNAEDFSARGFIGLSAGGLTIGLSLDRPEPWVKPFGVNGVSVLFPLGIEMTVSPALLPSSFALIGGLEVAGVAGEIVLSADVADLAKTAFSVKVENFDLKKIVTDIAGCNSCLGSVGNTLATASVDSLSGSFNPDPVNAVVVTAGGASATIPAGINLEVVDLNLWNVVKIEYGKFRVQASGFEAILIAKKLDWGPIEVTSADGSTGPSFELVLTTSTQRLGIDGRARILGKTVSVYIAFSDTSFIGTFMYSLGSSFSVEVTLSSTGTPGTGGFSSELMATMEGDIVSAIISQATAFLDTIDSNAQDDLDDANRDLASAQDDLDDAKDDLDAAEAKATRDIKSAQDDVDSLSSKLSSKKSSCNSKEKKCKKKPWKCGSVPVCWTEYGVIKAAKETADAALSAAIAATRGAINAAKASVNTASDAVDVASDAVDAASAVTGALSDLADAVGGSFNNVLQVQSLSFSAGLTSSSTAVSFSSRLRIVNTNINFAFSASPSFSNIKSQIESKTRSRLRSVYGGSIPAL